MAKLTTLVVALTAVSAIIPWSKSPSGSSSPTNFAARAARFGPSGRTVHSTHEDQSLIYPGRATQW